VLRSGLSSFDRAVATVAARFVRSEVEPTDDSCFVAVLPRRHSSELPVAAGAAWAAIARINAQALMRAADRRANVDVLIRR
jgi:hypothetical protein